MTEVVSRRGRIHERCRLIKEVNVCFIAPRFIPIAFNAANMVKILCLHGYGTSARIMESQLQTIRSMADPEWEFVFVDGEVGCKKAPGTTSRGCHRLRSDTNFSKGLGTFTSGPFLCYSDDFAPSNTRHSHDLITSVIEDEG